MTYVLPFKIPPRSNAQIESIQTGEDTMLSGNNSKDVTITAVITAKSFLLFTYKNAESSSARNDVNQAQGYILNSTTIRFSTNANVSATMTFRWYVVEFKATSSATVQHINNQTASGTTNNHTITAVNLSNAFPIITSESAGAAWDEKAYPSIEITTTTNLQVIYAAVNSSVYSAQIINNPRWTVAKYTHSLGTTSGIQDKTITAITLADIALLASGRPTSSFTISADKYWKFGMWDTTTIRYYRFSGGSEAWSFIAYVVDGNGDFTARHVESDTIFNGSATGTNTITALTDYTKAVLIAGSADACTGCPLTGANDGDDRAVKRQLNNNTTAEGQRVNTVGDIKWSASIMDFSPSF